MADLYTSYTDLAAHQTEGVDYERRQVPVTGATWCAIAIHGGGIEQGSGEVARAVGAGLMSHYEFAGIMNANNFATLHVTSTNFDEPIAQALVAGSLRCLSFHGYSGTSGLAQTSLGGLDTVTGARVRSALEAAGFSVIDAAQEIAGSDPANIANKTTLLAGVQVEMSNALRASFFPGGDLSRSMRDSGQRTNAFDAYVAAIRSAFDGRGRVSLGSVNVSRWATVPWPAADLDIVAKMGTDKLATGGSHFLHLTGRFVDVNNAYLARLACNTDQTITLTLRKRVAGTETLLATASGTGGLTHAAGRMFWVRLQIVGSMLKARVWQDGASEPSDWSVAVADSDLLAPGAIGARSILSSANTNTLPVAASYDGFRTNVSAISSWLHDSFARTVASDWGTSDSGRVWNRVGGGAASDYSVGAGYGVQVLSTLDTSRRTAVTAVHPDFDIYCDLTTSALATGDSLYGAVTARMLDASNMYLARLEFTTSNTIILTVRKIIADVQTTLGTYTVPLTHVAGTFVRVRFQGRGTALKAKAWLASTAEQNAWNIETTDATITAANQIGTRSIRVTGNTNTAAVEVRYDNFDVINPQTFSVARSRNGVVKAQSATTDVRLAYPTFVAL